MFAIMRAVPDRLEGAPRRVRREWFEAFKVRLVAETAGAWGKCLGDSAAGREGAIATVRLASPGHPRWNRGADRYGRCTALVDMSVLAGQLR